MALKYSIEYPDVKDVTHRLEIYDDDYVGSEIEVEGSIVFDYAQTEDPLEAIRGQGLRVTLEADSTLTFSDLYSEEQRTFPVKYIRNSVLLFNGWLNPEGWYEDFVSDKWRVSFDCVDGLSFLQDLSFVDSSGLNFIGFHSQLELIAAALERTGLQQNINVDIQIFYTGLATSNSILAKVKAAAQRYVKDDDNTVMSCEEVIRDILEPYAACLVSHEGEWFIYRPSQIFSDANLSYFRYDYQGSALSPSTSVKGIGFSLGSEVEGYYPHHCSGNQRIKNENSLGAYRVNYKYGQLKSILENSDLEYDSPGDPIPGWNVIGSNISTGGATVALTLKAFATSSIEMHSDDNTLATSLLLEIKVTGSVNRYPVPEQAYLKYQITLSDSGSSDVYYLSADGSWTTTVRSLGKTWYENQKFVLTHYTEATPVAGDIRVNVYTANGTNISGAGGTGGGSINLDSIYIGNRTEEFVVEGEFHTVQRTTKPSTKVDDVKEVFTGDNVEENYVGTLYKDNATDPTLTWFRSGITEEVPILQLMGEEHLRLKANISRVFSGDVYGFFNYFSRVLIDGVSGVFMPIHYSYDTKANIISAEFRQIHGGELTDIDYEKTLDYGKVVKPTIKG